MRALIDFLIMQATVLALTGKKDAAIRIALEAERLEARLKQISK